MAYCSLKDILQKFTSLLNTLYTPETIQFLFFECIQHRAAISKTVFYTRPEYIIDAEICSRIDTDLKRLSTGEPYQYIIGYVQFCKLPIQVDARALIPRPETEELCIEIHKRYKPQSSILDLCTGSGCIALTLKQWYPKNNVYAGDCSEAALDLCNENAKRLLLPLHTFLFNLYDTEIYLPNTGFDLIVSNPPYITPQEHHELDACVINFEPHLALFTPDEDGLLPYLQILKIAKQHLNAQGKLALELHSKTAHTIFKLMQDSSIFTSVELVLDMSGNTRFLFAQKR